MEHRGTEICCWNVDLNRQLWFTVECSPDRARGKLFLLYQRCFPKESVGVNVNMETPLDQRNKQKQKRLLVGRMKVHRIKDCFNCNVQLNIAWGLRFSRKSGTTENPDPDVWATAKWLYTSLIYLHSRSERFLAWLTEKSSFAEKDLFG